jgi:hypothetical protein
MHVHVARVHASKVSIGIRGSETSQQRVVPTSGNRVVIMLFTFDMPSGWGVALGHPSAFAYIPLQCAK